MYSNQKMKYNFCSLAYVGKCMCHLQEAVKFQHYWQHSLLSYSCHKNLKNAALDRALS